MEFGQISNFQDIDFSFERDPQFFFKTAPVQSPEFYLGAPIWNHKAMIEKISTAMTIEGTPLEVYSRFCNSIELNSTYYGTPPVERVQKWLKQTPETFKFFPKAPKSLTFYADHQFSVSAMDEYLSSLRFYGDQLGGSFLQFSPYIQPQSKRSLFNVLEALPSDFRFFIELRHPDWFSHPIQWQRLCEYLAKKEIGLVTTDTPGRRDVLHLCASTPHLMVRFKGNNSHATDYTRLENWLQLFSMNPHLESISFFHHHSDESFCFETLEWMQNQLGIEKKAFALPTKSVDQLSLEL